MTGGARSDAIWIMFSDSLQVETLLKGTNVVTLGSAQSIIVLGENFQTTSTFTCSLDDIHQLQGFALNATHLVCEVPDTFTGLQDGEVASSYLGITTETVSILKISYTGNQ